MHEQKLLTLDECLKQLIFMASPESSCIGTKKQLLLSKNDVCHDQYFSSQKNGHQHLVSYPLAPENIVAEAEGSLGLKCGPRCVELSNASNYHIKSYQVGLNTCKIESTN